MSGRSRLANLVGAQVPARARHSEACVDLNTSRLLAAGEALESVAGSSRSSSTRLGSFVAEGKRPKLPCVENIRHLCDGVKTCMQPEPG